MIIVKSIQSYHNPMGLQHIRFVSQLFEIAEKDLQSSRILYANELYAQSIYFLQQSVEKLVKGYAILFERLTPKEIKYDIKHITPKAFVLVFLRWWKKFRQFISYMEKYDENYKFIKLVNKLEERFPSNNYISDKKLLKEITKNLRDVAPDIARAEVKTLRETLGINRKYREEFHNWLDDDERFLEDIDMIIASDEYILPKDITKDRREKEITFMRKNPKTFLNITNMITLSIITYPHEEYTRYPKNEGKEDLSPIEYKKELGIVRYYNKIRLLQEEALKWFKDDLDRCWQTSNKLD